MAGCMNKNHDAVNRGIPKKYKADLSVLFISHLHHSYTLNMGIPPAFFKSFLEVFFEVPGILDSGTISRSDISIDLATVLVNKLVNI
jgi:hypothetical protein